MFFTVLAFITFKFCAIREISINAKAHKLQILQPYTGSAGSNSLGKEPGAAILTSTVCDSHAEKFEKPQQRASLVMQLVMQLIKIIIATVM